MSADETTTSKPDARLSDPRIPPIGAVSQAERSFIVNWVSTEWYEGSAPYVSPDFVARQGRNVRLVDIRAEREMPGVLGYVPGSDWLPLSDIDTWQSKLDPKTPVIVISRSGHRGGAVAERLKAAGFPLVAAMQGGLWHWRDVGLETSFDPSIRERRGALRELGATWEARKAVLTREQVEAHLGDPYSTRWMKLAALLVNGRLSCVDGRDATGVLGTPGGDAGEFALLLAATEHVTARTIDPDKVVELLARRVAVFGHFYVHTDIHASNQLIQAMRADARLDAALAQVYEPLEWRRFFMGPPPEVRERVLEHALLPAHLGCGHLRHMANDPAAYGVRPGLVHDVLRGVYTQRWRGDIDVEMSVLPGGHAEGGVLLVMLEAGVAPFSRIPLVSPQAEGSQLFVAHPQVAGYLREQQAHFLGMQRDLLDLGHGQVRDIERTMAELGAQQTACTLGRLAKGLPVFEARFDERRRFRVRQVGAIE
jgi:rhodanese-related sulfurtransferase